MPRSGVIAFVTMIGLLAHWPGSSFVAQATVEGDAARDRCAMEFAKCATKCLAALLLPPPVAEVCEGACLVDLGFCWSGCPAIVTNGGGGGGPFTYSATPIMQTYLPGSSVPIGCVRVDSLTGGILSGRRQVTSVAVYTLGQADWDSTLALASQPWQPRGVATYDSTTSSWKRMLDSSLLPDSAGYYVLFEIEDTTASTVHAHAISRIRPARTTLGVADDRAAADFSLELHPNPATTTRSGLAVSFILRSASEADLAVFDAAGRKVATIFPSKYLPAGRHADIRWSGLDSSGERVRSGVYFVRLTVGSRQQVLRTVLLEARN